MASEVCFSRQDFNTYMVMLLFLLAYILYILYSQRQEHMANADLLSSLTAAELKDKIQDLENKLFNIQLAEQRCQSDLQASREALINGGVQTRFINKIYNPLAPPLNIIPEGTFSTPPYDAYQMYQNIGYLTSNGRQFPLFGRYKYPGRSDRWEYYTIDDSRGRIKIPFKTVNYNELYDGDNVTIAELGGNFGVKIYDNDGLRYDPNVY